MLAVCVAGLMCYLVGEQVSRCLMRECWESQASSTGSQARNGRGEMQCGMEMMQCRYSEQSSTRMRVSKITVGDGWKCKCRWKDAWAGGIYLPPPGRYLCILGFGGTRTMAELISCGGGGNQKSIERGRRAWRYGDKADLQAAGTRKMQRIYMRNRKLQSLNSK